jgi:hypothetical protein
MAGINYGNKYTYKKKNIQDSELEVGVFFSDLSNKWRVQVFNETVSKHTRPIIAIAQFENKKDAEKYFNKHKKK